MEYEGRLLRVTGEEVTFKLDRDFDIAEAQRITVNGNPRSIVRTVDERNMTKDQNGMIHGLFNDISLYTGYPPEYVKDLMKTMFAAYKGIDSFSMANYEISQVFAGEFIEYILEFCFEQEIPFKYEKFHLASDITRVLFIYAKYRMCFVCGKPHADADHYDSVGAGRNRKTIDHSKHRYFFFCRNHHSERHQIGVESMMKKYVIVPIKLPPDLIKTLKIT